MGPRSRTTPETEPDPMLPEQFEFALAATQIRTPELIAACRAVLVDKAPGKEVAKRYGIEPSSIYRATGIINEKWQEACATQGWDYISVAVPQSLTPLVLGFQRLLLNSTEKKTKRGARGKKK